MDALILPLQVAAALLWALACAFLLPSTSRALVGRSRQGDEWRSVIFFAGIIIAFGAGGRAADMTGPTWLLIYASLILVAGYVLLLLWNGRAR